jgi:hypothetical protein
VTAKLTKVLSIKSLFLILFYSPLSG